MAARQTNLRAARRLPMKEPPRISPPPTGLDEVKGMSRRCFGHARTRCRDQRDAKQGAGVDVGSMLDRQLLVHCAPAQRSLMPFDVEHVRGHLSFSLLAGVMAQCSLIIRFGVYLTRQEIESRGTSRLSDLLRTKRGIAIVSARGHAALRFTRYADKSGQTWGNLGGGFTLPPPARTPGQPSQQESMATPLADCKPAVWLDGVNMLDMEIDDLLAMDVEAVELYETQTGLPLEFAPTSRDRFCGVVVIWTRTQ